MARRGRRPGDADTRQLILEAARSTFAEVGYQRATIRLIASRAGVDPALVHHYFAGKERLFAAAVHFPFPAAEAVEMIFAEGIDQVGERLVRLFFGVWEREESREALLGQLRRAMVTPGEPIPFAEFITSAMLPRAAPRLPGNNQQLRIELAASHLVGVAVLRYVIRLEPVASTPLERLIEELVPRIQPYFTGELR
jgi:AcrR family transcriptional regulator